MIDDGVCGKYGCAYWPIIINETTKSYHNNFCLPISFSPDGPEDSLRARTAAAQIPPPEPLYIEMSLVKGNEKKDTFLIKNGTKHAIASGAVFEKHGWEFSDVITIDQIWLEHYPVGADIKT